MGTAAISYLRIDLEHYALALRRVANLGATFFIKSTLSRMEYIQEIEDLIIGITRQFNSTFDVNERMRLINILKAEFELAEREYQLLRMGNHVKYIVTDIFEDHGVLKYTKIGGGILAGVAQVLGGVGVYEFSKIVHSKKLKGISVVLVTHGINNTFESISPLIYDRYKTGYVRDVYRLIAKKMGYNIDQGDFAYSSVDFAATAYAAYAGRALVTNKNSLVSRSWLDKPGTGRLYNATSNDYGNTFLLKSRMLKIIQTGSTGYKFKVTFLDEDYKFDNYSPPK
jgi:hypothetical protein